MRAAQLGKNQFKTKVLDNSTTFHGFASATILFDRKELVLPCDMVFGLYTETSELTSSNDKR